MVVWECLCVVGLTALVCTERGHKFLVACTALFQKTMIRVIIRATCALVCTTLLDASWGVNARGRRLEFEITATKLEGTWPHDIHSAALNLTVELPLQAPNPSPHIRNKF